MVKETPAHGGLMLKQGEGWIALVAMAVLLPLASASPVAVDSHVVTSEKPGGADYLVETVVVDVAGTLTLTNVDLRNHDVVSDANGPETNPWCERYLTRECPLFASPLIGLGEQAEVEGIDQLTPLESYEFHCSIHPWMRGTIIAV